MFMADILIGIHAALGEFAVLAALWVFVEMLNPTAERIRRAKAASILVALFIFASWLAGGYYYVTVYGSAVKPIIKAGPQPWAHAIFTETKEHVFLFLPFLSLFLLSLMGRLKDAGKGAGMRVAVLATSLMIVLIGLSMVGMGYLISTGVRTALEAGAAV